MLHADSTGPSNSVDLQSTGKRLSDGFFGVEHLRPRYGKQAGVPELGFESARRSHELIMPNNHEQRHAIEYPAHWGTALSLLSADTQELSIVS